jgi:biopolymer transport protein ExbB
MNFMEFLKQTDNLLHVLPIMLAFFFAVVIITERVRSLFYKYPMKDTQSFFDQITGLILSGKTSEAVSLCEQNKEKPITHVVKSGILRAHLPESLIQNTVEMAVSDASHTITKRTAFLATLANLATLLGLFGTIQGLIKAFQAVKFADPQQKSALLTEGISTAMNATMMGLGVAILCMAAFALLVNQANKLASDIDKSGIQILDILKQRYYADDLLDESQVKQLHHSNGSGSTPADSSQPPQLRRVA